MSKRNRKQQPAKNTLGLNDWHLWTEVTRSVSPLRKAKPAASFEQAQQTDTVPSPKKSMPSDQRVWSPGATPIHHRPDPGYSTDLIKKTRPQADIEPRIRRRLMRGQLPIDATIDLHGLRQAEAHAALCRFVAARHARGDRTILVITGKGLKKTGPNEIEQRGVLRSMLPHWLAEPALAPLVAGWQVSAQTHGGEGAYYVRLRRQGR